MGVEAGAGDLLRGPVVEERDDLPRVLASEPWQRVEPLRLRQTAQEALEGQGFSL